MMPVELRTEKGLRYFNYGFILALIAYGVMIILIIAIIITLTSQTNEGTQVWGTLWIWAPFIWFVLGMAFAYLILFISLILFFLGLIYLSNGKWEFGPLHSSFNQKGMLFILIGFVISLFGGFGFGMLGPFVGVVTTILISLGLMYLIQEIADDNGKRMLRIASILFIIISIISAIATFWFLFLAFATDVRIGVNAIDPFLWSVIIPMVIGNLAIIPIFLFFLAYRRTYFRVKNREIIPLPPPPMMPYPMGYPPYYPPYPPPYHQPYYPPRLGPPLHYGSNDIGIKPMQQSYSEPADSVEQYPTETAICVSCKAIIPKDTTVCSVCNSPQYEL